MLGLSPHVKEKGPQRPRLCSVKMKTAMPYFLMKKETQKRSPGAPRQTGVQITV